MEPDDPRAIGELLAALVTAANEHTGVALLLHEHVTLHRLDGVALQGREAVIDAVVSRGRGARLRVLSSQGDAVVVALEIVDTPGYVRFEMHGTLRDGRLYDLWMRG